MHYRDLTPYTYSNVNGGERVVNVGWLDVNEPYERGRVPSHIIETLI